jgi:hypothetical protein
VLDWYFPVAQPKQTPDPVPAWYHPVEQLTQEVLETAPVDDRYLPAEQLAHEPEARTAKVPVGRLLLKPTQKPKKKID